MPSASTMVYPVYAIVSPDRSLRLDALNELRAGWKGQMDVAGVTRVDGAEALLADVLDEVRTPSLLGDRCIVIVEEADPFITDHRQVLERYCSAPSNTGTLVLSCRTLPTTTRLHKIINEHGKVIVREVPKGRAVAPWIVNRAQQKYGKRLAGRAAQMLRDHIGDAPGLLDAELAKLSDYVGRRIEITPADIEALTGHQREEKVFAVTDAMSAGDTATALTQWEQVLATDRAAVGRSIAGMAWGVRRLLEARRDWERGVQLPELAKRLFTDVGTARQRLERLTTERLEAQQRDLLAADLAVKTGGSTVRVAVEKFIVTHSAGRRALRSGT